MNEQRRNSTNPPGLSVEEREAVYWDQCAEQVRSSDLTVVAEPEGPLENCIVKEVGDVAGLRVLDVGCGTGESAVRWALRGATVSAVDISPVSVAVTASRARANGVEGKVSTAVMSATELGFADASFDRVYGQDIIHHLEAAAFGREVARVLNSDGRCVFHENSANNSLLMFARNRLCGRFGLSKWSSDDEYPLTRERLGEFGEAFEETEVRYPEFLFFHYANAKLFSYRNAVVNHLSAGADAAIWRLFPPVRRYSYRQVIRCDRPLFRSACA